MNKLFTKIFISFWLVIVIVIGVTVVALYKSKPEVHQLPPPIARVVVKAERHFKRAGEVGLIRWLQQVNRASGNHKVFAIKDDNELLNRDIDMPIHMISKKLSEDKLSIQQRIGRHIYFGHYLATRDEDNGIRLIFKKPHINKAMFKHLTISLWLGLISLILLSGLACYILARHLTKPVRLIRAASRSMAEGDLDIEVSSQLGKRNDELSAMAHDFEDMARQIKQVYDNQNHLIQDMSHELRSPVARMQVALAILAKDTDHPMLTRIEQDLDQFEHIIEHTLSIPTFNVNDIDLNQQIDLLGVLDKVVEDLNFEIPGLEQRIKIQLPNSLDPQLALLVASKDNWLETIFRNLISNANQYSDSDTDITVRVSDKQSNAYQPSIEISIENHGQGVSEEHLKSIFAPYFRSDQARTPGSRNVGLGLAIVNKYVELHKGQVMAENLTDNDDHIIGFKVIVSLPTK